MVTPLGCGVETSWRRLLAGDSGAGRVERFDVSDLPCKIACSIPRGDGSDGTYNPVTGIFTAPNGQQKFFVASDHVESPQYRTLTPDDLFDVVVRHNLHFGQTRQTGVVFHMMSALGELGRTGLTAVGNSHEDAKATYERAVAVLDEETLPPA